VRPNIKHVEPRVSGVDFGEKKMSRLYFFFYEMLAAALVAANLGIVASYFIPCVPALLPRRVVSLPWRGPRTANLAGAGGSEWWEERGSVPFECSECGKCCKVRGDVWASPEDVVRLAAHLNIEIDDFAEKYGRLEVGKLLVCSFSDSPSTSLTHGLSRSFSRSFSRSIYLFLFSFFDPRSIPPSFPQMGGSR
jgi:hypothetical protein